MSGDRKKKPVERDGPSRKERLRAKLWELANPEPKDAYEPDPPESLQLGVRINRLPKSWQQPARELVEEYDRRGLTAGEMHLELDRWQSLHLEFPPEDFPPKWKRAGGRSTEARKRWCDAILEVATPDDEAKFLDVTERTWVAAGQAVRGEPITDADFEGLQDCPWVGRERSLRQPPLLKNIRAAARKRWKKKLGRA